MKNTEPKSFIQGESLVWSRSFDDYKIADGWTLTYYFRGAGKGFDAVVGVDDVSVVASNLTAQCAVGNYSWQLFAEKGSEKILLDSGTVEVRAGLFNTSADQMHDGRSENKKILDAIRAMIAKKATLDQQEYAIGNRQLKRIPVTELIMLEQKYTQKVVKELQAERLRKGGKFFKQILIRMK